MLLNYSDISLSQLSNPTMGGLFIDGWIGYSNGKVVRECIIWVSVLGGPYVFANLEGRQSIYMIMYIFWGRTEAET